MSKRINLILRFGLSTALMILLGVTASADLVDDLSKQPDVRGARISPAGDYIAVLKEEDDKRVVAVFNFPSMKLINVVDFPGRSEVGSYRWVNDERLLFSIAVDWGNREDDVSYGELYAVNANGKKGKYLFGIRGNSTGATNSRLQSVTAARARASFTHPVWDDPEKVLITISDFNRGYKSATTFAKLDVYTGRISERRSAPTANAQILANPAGDAQFSYYIDDDQNTLIFERDQDSGEWREFSKAAYGQSQLTPIDVAEDGRIFVTKSEDDGPEGVYLFDPLSRKLELVHQHELVDANRLYQDFDSRVYGVEFTPAKLEQIITDPDHPSAQLIEELRNVFPGAYATVGSTTHDFDLSIVALHQDVRTPEFYLYDRKKGELRKLFDALPWIDDNLLSPMEPFQMTSRDGMELHGYLTIPRGAEAKNLPLVVVPHGGPHGPRDEWGYQWFEGFVPAAGYAMLQLNYRGSGGYGMAFERSGYGEWGKKMQDDITDATKWVIEQGIADPDRICIFGWSYGGYATLMGIVREPDLYKCAVAGAGVYDQDVQYNKADFADQTRWGKKYMDKVIGPSAEDRKKASPINYLDRIKTPLLLVHGEDDERVPIEHAYVLRKKMKQAGKPVPELIELRNEPHSPRKEEHNILWKRKTVEFFEKHIGPGVRPNDQASR